MSDAAERAAIDIFTEYFVANYPGPNTIINDPKWHAPKIFRAAEYALGKDKAALSQSAVPIKSKSARDYPGHYIPSEDGNAAEYWADGWNDCLDALSQSGEPVAWRIFDVDGNIHFTSLPDKAIRWANAGEPVTELYTHPVGDKTSPSETPADTHQAPVVAYCDVETLIPLAEQLCTSPAPLVEPSDWGAAYRAELAKWPQAAEQTENTTSSIKSIFWFRSGYEAFAKRNESTREAVVKECAQAAKDEMLVENTGLYDDIAYNMAVRDCVATILALSTKGNAGGETK